MQPDYVKRRVEREIVDTMKNIPVVEIQENLYQKYWEIFKKLTHLLTGIMLQVCWLGFSKSIIFH